MSSRRKYGMSKIKEVLSDTKEVFSTRWTPGSLRVPSWVVSAMIWITWARTISYGLELMLINDTRLSGILLYADLVGVAYWGISLLIASVVLAIGLISRNAMVVTIGTLLSGAVWLGFSLTMGFGWANTGTGGRFFAAAFLTALTWAIFFFLQIKSFKKNGVGPDALVS